MSAWLDYFGSIEVPFRCNDGMCIPEHMRCNGGEPDCDGGEDESTCGKGT